MAQGKTSCLQDSWHNLMEAGSGMGTVPTTLSSWNVLESEIKMLNSAASEVEGTLGIIQSTTQMGKLRPRVREGLI